MSIFSAKDFVLAMQVCEKPIRGLADLLFRQEDEAGRNAYLAACEKNDRETINRAIDQAFCRLLHADSVREGMVGLVEKFPEINFELENQIFDKDIVRRIALHAAEMLQIVERDSCG